MPGYTCREKGVYELRLSILVLELGLGMGQTDRPRTTLNALPLWKVDFD